MAKWRVRRPPDSDEELARWTLGDTPDLRTLRAALKVAVDGQPADDREDLAERITIVATELAGNAMRHGRPPTLVVLVSADGELVVDVHDNDLGSAPAVAESRRLGDGGLGLMLAERLAQDVGWYATDTGKGVWVAFALAGR